MSAAVRTIVDSKLFRAAITAVILFAGVLAGLETDAALVAQHGGLLKFLDTAVLGIFLAVRRILELLVLRRIPFLLLGRCLLGSFGTGRIGFFGHQLRLARWENI